MAWRQRWPWSIWPVRTRPHGPSGRGRRVVGRAAERRRAKRIGAVLTLRSSHGTWRFVPRSLTARPSARARVQSSRYGTGEVSDCFGRTARATRAELDGGEVGDPGVLPARVRARV